MPERTARAHSRIRAARPFARSRSPAAFGAAWTAVALRSAASGARSEPVRRSAPLTSPASTRRLDLDAATALAVLVPRSATAPCRWRRRAAAASDPLAPPRVGGPLRRPFDLGASLATTRPRLLRRAGARDRGTLGGATPCSRAAQPRASEATGSSRSRRARAALRLPPRAARPHLPHRRRRRRARSRPSTTARRIEAFWSSARWEAPWRAAPSPTSSRRRAVAGVVTTSLLRRDRGPRRRALARERTSPRSSPGTSTSRAASSRATSSGSSTSASSASTQTARETLPAARPHPGGALHGRRGEPPAVYFETEQGRGGYYRPDGTLGGAPVPGGAAAATSASPRRFTQRALPPDPADHAPAPRHRLRGARRHADLGGRRRHRDLHAAGRAASATCVKIQHVERLRLATTPTCRASRRACASASACARSR